MSRDLLAVRAHAEGQVAELKKDNKFKPVALKTIDDSFLELLRRDTETNRESQHYSI